MSYFDILVKGKNLAYLFERLRKQKINVLKVVKKDDNTIILRILKKDSGKVFAILDNSWYNKLIKQGGLFGLISGIKKRIFFFASVLAFVVITQVLKNVVFTVEINGMNGNDKTKLYNNLSSYGIEKYCNYNSLNVAEIKKNILSDFETMSFVTIEKSGNRLIINGFERPKNDFVNDLNQSCLIATVSGKLIRLNVFSGTQNKFVGDYVLVGDALILGKIVTEKGEFSSQALGYAVIECEHVYEKTVEDCSFFDKNSVINEAIFFTPCACTDNIIAYSLQETKVGNGLQITVKVSYLVEIGG